MKNSTFTPLLVGASMLLIQSCSQPIQQETIEMVHAQSETCEYFLLRSGMTQSTNYNHAVKMGNDIIISGSVKTKCTNNSTSAIGNLEQHIRNAYSNFEKILDGYLSTIEGDVVKKIAPNNLEINMEYAGHSKYHPNNKSNQ